MSITNVANLWNNLNGILESVARYNEAVTVTSKSGNVVILSESEYNSLKETIFLMSAPRVRKELAKAKKADPSEYEDYDPSQAW